MDILSDLAIFLGELHNLSKQLSNRKFKASLHPIIRLGLIMHCILWLATDGVNAAGQSYNKYVVNISFQPQSYYWWWCGSSVETQTLQSRLHPYMGIRKMLVDRIKKWKRCIFYSKWSRIENKNKVNRSSSFCCIALPELHFRQMAGWEDGWVDRW